MSTQFGIDVTTDDILDTLSFFDSWEDRYRYIIDLGKELPPMDDALKTEDRIVKGCQSQVWLAHEEQGGNMNFIADSDAHIVRGLLAVILAAYNGKNRQQILDFDIEDYFERLDLIRHLSPTRGNGLRAMVGRIRDTAAS
ncbi:SufE family protein [Saccharospirillum salsuginis]|uniref:Cysteine desulfurase, sulfur acceptor subunit CsdE n=1 Tax=Saccharospirillum salsuginis TaxID=418750 RepID=A0A918JZ01_9GAMM|nr:SufE family protein [Saccharospirillum salsuginis]GGX38485.1 cysteine desulfurase, sulfur acceptor subunit CsdE [Saccharospirillum salsuginis]